METMLSWIRAAALALLPVWLVAPVQAGTWIVDQNGGPGVHFTDLPPAIAAALPGDVILVRGGSYTPFTLTKGLTILGKQGPWPTGTYISCCVPSHTLIAPPAGETAVLADLQFGGDVRAIGSAGVVIMDRVLTGRTFLIDQCADVRLNRHTGAGLIVKSSRFEVGSSTLNGYTQGIHGGTALSIQGISQGLVTRTSCIGGDGDDVPIGLPGNGGDGGYGIVIQAPVPAVS